MKFKLGELIEFVNERVKLSKLNENNYISTENMVPNKGGITKASNLPSVESVIAFRREDTLFSNIRTYFEKIFYADFNGGASPDVLVMRSKDNLILEPMYLYYLVTNKKFIDYTVLTSKGAKMPRGDKTAILNFELNLPSLSEQRKTSKILGDLDNKITLNRQINQTLEAMAQALFKSWFVDFEPVKAKLSALAVGGSADDANLAAMSAISGKTTEQLLALKTTNPDQFQQLYTTANLFPSEMVDSELGEIPKGWEVKAFGDVIDKYIDNRGKTPPLVNDGIPLLEVKHLTETSAFPNLKADKKISEDTYNTWFRAHVQEKDILISTVGTIGRTSFVKDTNLAIAQNVLGLRFSEKVTPEYMFYLIKDSHFQHGVNSRLVITVQSSIKRKDLNTISLLVPSNTIVMHFTSKIANNLNAQFNLYKEIESLIDLRDTMLPKLLAGELLVDGA